MTAYQFYERSIKPLSIAEKFTLARLIINEIVPESGPQSEAYGTIVNGLLPQSELATARKPREFGAGCHLLSRAKIDVDELMAVPIEDMFADYMPGENL